MRLLITLLFFAALASSEVSAQAITTSVHGGISARPFFYLLGHGLLEEKKSGDAVTTFERAAQIYPRNRYMLQGLSEALEAAGRKREALEAFERAYEVARSSADAEERQFVEQRRRALQKN